MKYFSTKTIKKYRNYNNAPRYINLTPEKSDASPKNLDELDPMPHIKFYNRFTSLGEARELCEFPFFTFGSIDQPTVAGETVSSFFLLQVRLPALQVFLLFNYPGKKQVVTSKDNQR
jgi:hypothetical protein